MQKIIQKSTKQKPLCKIFKKAISFKDKLLDYVMQDNENHIPRKALKQHNLFIEEETKRLMSNYENKRPLVNGITNAIYNFFQENYFTLTKEQMDLRMNELSNLFSRNAEIDVFLSIYKKHIYKYFESNVKKSTCIPLEVNLDIEFESKTHASKIINKYFSEYDNFIRQIETAPKEQNSGPSVLSIMHLLFI